MATKAENRFELTDMKKLAQDYANGDTSRISRKTYDSIISKLEKLHNLLEKDLISDLKALAISFTSADFTP